MKITSFGTYVLAEGFLEALKCIYQTVQHHIPEDTYLHNQTMWKKHLYMTKPVLKVLVQLTEKMCRPSENNCNLSIICILVF